jgi:prepilin-type N-terminal cleavage/methylation domain-containing protein
MSMVFPATARRRGLTLIELMISVAILSATAAALGMMARAVEIANEYNQSYGTATQHARVTLDRLDRAINQASANDSYCGVWVVEDTIGSYNFPDTLVVWRPSSGTATNPQGTPMVSELTIFCPDPSASNNLVEITLPNDSRTMSSPTNTSTYKTFINSLKTDSGANKVLLTDLVHTASISGQTRAALRFVVTLNPSQTEWNSYQSSSSTFASLSWAQGIQSPSAGLRQVWVRTELQLMPSGTWSATNSAAQQAVPYFGSSAYYYEMTP